MIHEQNTKVFAIALSEAVTDNASVTTAEIDTIGFDYCMVHVYIGTTDTPLTALKVQESDTSGSGFADVTGLIAGSSTAVGGSTSTLPGATDDDKWWRFDIDLRGRKRYLDLVATVDDGTTGAWVHALAILGRKKEGIDTAAEAGCEEILRV